VETTRNFLAQNPDFVLPSDFVALADSGSPSHVAANTITSGGATGSEASPATVAVATATVASGTTLNRHPVVFLIV